MFSKLETVTKPKILRTTPSHLSYIILLIAVAFGSPCLVSAVTDGLTCPQHCCILKGEMSGL